mgnify:CR=1 FL=1
MKKTILAAIQMASSPSVSGNLVEAGRLIQAASAKGAKLIALPENFALMGLHENDKLEVAEAEDELVVVAIARVPKLAVFCVGRERDHPERRRGRGGLPPEVLSGVRPAGRDAPLLLHLLRRIRRAAAFT